MTEISQPASTPADAVSGNWVDRFAPGPAKPYLRLMRADRPIGTWLLLLPCWQGIALAAAGEPAPDWPRLAGLFALFGLGAVVMRGAGCTYNDIVDRDFDGRVARTALRPIPAGQVRVWQAATFLGALCLIGLGVLLQLNLFTIYLGIGSLALVAVYPFAKRVTYWPQIWLGLTFNCGALMGYAAMTGGLNAAPFLLYAAGIFWTLGYDTIYAHQDKEDDALIGVKSSALRLGEKTAPAIACFYIAMTALYVAIGAVGGFSAVYYIALMPGAAHLFWQWRRLDIHNSPRCLALFRSNRVAGLLFLAPLLLETMT